MNASTATDGRRWGGRALDIAAVVVAGVLQLIVLVPFTVASGLVAPLWAIVLFYALWATGAVVLFVLARRRPLLTPLVPVANAAVLWASITGGERLLGWTA